MKRFFIILIYACVLVGVSALYASGQRFGWDDLEQFLKKPHTWKGMQTFDTVDINGGAVDSTTIGATSPSTGVFSSLQANETLGGVSTFVITGNLDMTTLASATAAFLTAGRPIEINATSSPYIDLPAMTSLSNVTNYVLFVDVTTVGDDSGVTIRSTTNHIHAGVGSTYTSGGTIFVNSGNTRFKLALKALNMGSGVTPAWEVWSFNGNTLRRP